MIRTLFCLAFCAAATAFAKEKPNIIVIFTDDQVFRGIGYHHPEVKTPHLDALAASGTIFERAYFSSPICAASRASVMTGLFPQQNGVIGLNTKLFQAYRKGQPKADQTLAVRLAKAGYHTAFFGKSHLGDPLSYGFHEGRELPRPDDRDTFRAATQFLESHQNDAQPFFLWIAPRQPHVPLYPEEKWLDLYPPGSISLPENFRVKPTRQSLNNQGTPGQHFYRDSNYRKNHDNLPAGPPRDEKTMRAFTRAYYAVISRLDDQIGRLTDRLRETGQLDNTVVFILSDNGYHLGSHGLGNKITMHEESVRVPMFAFGDGIPQGKKTSALVSSLDLFPTLIELARAPAPPQPIMGKSLLPLLENPDASHREVIFSECVGVGGKPGQGHRMARSDRWKLILSGRDEIYLFDTQNDPYERHNFVADPAHAPTLKQLSAELANWMKAIGDRPFPGH